MDTGLEIELVMAVMALGGLVVSTLAFASSSKKSRDERQREREENAEERGALRQWQLGVDDDLTGKKAELAEIRDEVERENRSIREDMKMHHGELQLELRSIHKTLGELRGTLARVNGI